MFAKKTKSYFFGFALVFVFIQSGSVLAQDVEEVVVEAEQSANAPIDDMASVSAIDGEKLADAGIENVEDVAAYVPNLVLSETDTGTNIVIRGIGAGVNQGFDQSVGLYIDGVPLPRGQMARAPFLDLAGVQVLRGPQYVRDGNYSIAGSVHMITNAASDQFELGLDLDYVPGQNDRTLLLTTGLPIGDLGGLRLAVQKQTSDGYIENVALSQDGPQSDNLLIRSVLTFNPTDNLSFKLKYEDGKFDGRGRQIEILESQRTPDYREFQLVRDLGGRSPGNVQDFTFSLASDYRTNIDEILIAQRSLYDTRVIGVRHNVNVEDPGPLDPDADGTELIPAFAGTSYLEYLRNLYTGEGELQNIDAGGRIFEVNDRAYTPPPGLLDSDLNFKRAADIDEFSENDSTNITLNTELLLGEHKLDLVASSIEYEVTERIDSDFTPVPILQTDQSETYEQQFFRLEYTSPQDRVFEFSVGASYLESELEFDEAIDVKVPGPQNQEEANAYIQLNASQGAEDSFRLFENNVVFDENFPAKSIFGRVSQAFNSGLFLYNPNRTFKQDNETHAAFFEAKVNWTDSFRTIFGARYTRSEKEAIRDFAFLLRNGETFRLEGAQGEDNVRVRNAEIEAAFALGQVFNFGQHTTRSTVFAEDGEPVADVLPPDQGVREEEAFLPSINIEWDATPDLSLRAAVRMANKLGGFDARSNSSPGSFGGTALQPGTFEFEDEDATTFELGARWYLPNGYGELIATAFYTDFKNLQVSAQDRAVGFNVQNAGAARTTGVEVEGLLALTENFNINYSMAWIDFQFTDYKLATCPLPRRPDYVQITSNIAIERGVVPELFTLYELNYDPDFNFISASREDSKGFGVGDQQVARPELPIDQQSFLRYDFRGAALPRFCDFEGQTNQYVAEWQGTFTFNYESEPTRVGVVRSTLDVLYNSGYETTVTQDSDVAQGEYVQLNGRVGLKSQDDIWELALTGENLTNEKIVLFANEVPLATRILGSKSHYGFVRSPRAIGLNFRYKFY